MHIVIECPGNEAYADLERRLAAFNRSHAPPWTAEVFTVVLRDADGSLRGGARAVVRLGSVEIRVVWLDEELRTQKLGETIIRAVEDEARTRGARAALLDTYEFQARGFYERLGYTCFGIFEYPDGVKRFYLSRTL
jgi:GNAT superfamily N-acetyltransferase